MAVIRIVRRLREEPLGAPVRRADGTAIDLPEGTIVEVIGQDPRGWTQVQANMGVAVEGWVSSDGIADGDEFSLSKTVFAEQCVSNGVTYGANAYYLMTVALARTKIKSLAQGQPDSPVGPLGITAREWETMRRVTDSLIDYSVHDITLWTAQVSAFAVSTHATSVRLGELIGVEPSIDQLYFSQTFGSSALRQALTAPEAEFAGLVAGLDADELLQEGIDLAAAHHRFEVLGGGATTRQTLEAIGEFLKPHFDEAVDHVRPAADKFIAAMNASGVSAPKPTTALNFASPHLNTTLKRTNANKIAAAFAASGYGAIAQIAAVANAIGESGLNHKASNTNGEDSHGLFQLNRSGGVGTGHSITDLQDADNNISIMLNHILEPHNKSARQTFLTTNKIAEAVQVFVYEFERPADKAGATSARIQIANSIKL